MGAAALLLMRPRLRHRTGPALRRAPVPFSATVLSLLSHTALGLAVVLGASAWNARQPKMYIVNLVPAVAAVGTPEPRPPAPPPQRVEERPRVTPPRAPSQLPERPAPRPAPSLPEMPSRPPSLPDRAVPEAVAPDRTPPPLPRTPPPPPRPSEKELPPVASATTPVPVPPPTPTPAPAPARVEPPPQPLGRPSGSAQGNGAVTVTVSDFPYALYLASVQRKIGERWESRALQGRQPVAVFEIGRDGRISGLSIEKTSGNPYYDQAALRAITEAVPFPPLPTDYPAPTLRIHLGFNFAQDRG